MPSGALAMHVFYGVDSSARAGRAFYRIRNQVKTLIRACHFKSLSTDNRPDDDDDDFDDIRRTFPAR